MAYARLVGVRLNGSGSREQLILLLLKVFSFDF